MCGSFKLSYFNFFFQPLMDQYFERIQQLLDRSDFPVRIRFMIEDVIDLRNSKVTLNACNFLVHNNDFSWSITVNRYLLSLFPRLLACKGLNAILCSPLIAYFLACRTHPSVFDLHKLLQCSPQAPAAGVFAGYLCIKRRLLLVHKSKEKLCFSFARFARFVISA